MTRLADAYSHRELTLLVERAVWCARSRTLWVADVHLGKAATYRAYGQPAPAGTTQENLARLTSIIEARGAARLIVLGDLFHARQAFTPALLAAFREWRDRHRRIAMVLVRGNHDIRAGDPDVALQIDVVGEPHSAGAVEGRHHPLARTEAIAAAGPTVLAGHLHPTVRLHGRGRDSMRFPCFILHGRQVVLPAFGEFTGGSNADVAEGASVCAITEAGLAFVGQENFPDFSRGRVGTKSSGRPS
jgi:DNA ligase-associated metallophosphoesterase